jgi:hypothetical protein
VNAAIAVNRVKTGETYIFFRIQFILEKHVLPFQTGSITSSVMSVIANHIAIFCCTGNIYFPWKSGTALTISSSLSLGVISVIIAVAKKQMQPVEKWPGLLKSVSLASLLRSSTKATGIQQREPHKMEWGFRYTGETVLMSERCAYAGFRSKGRQGCSDTKARQFS